MKKTVKVVPGFDVTVKTEYKNRVWVCLIDLLDFRARGVDTTEDAAIEDAVQVIRQAFHDESRP